MRRVGANCEPGIRGLSLAKYRAGPPRTRLSPGRTRDYSDLAGRSPRWRKFRSPSRPTEINAKTSAQGLESKTARSRGWRGCETQSSRVPYTTLCDGHCQALWLAGSVLDTTGSRLSSPAGVGSLSPSVTCPASSDRLITMSRLPTPSPSRTARSRRASCGLLPGRAERQQGRHGGAAALRCSAFAIAADDVRGRLVKVAGRKLTQEGVLIITAQRYRTQERNRQDALERLVALIRRAVVRPAPRRRTKPPPAPGGVAWPPRAAALASRSSGRHRPPSSRTGDPPRMLTSHTCAVPTASSS